MGAGGLGPALPPMQSSDLFIHLSIQLASSPGQAYCLLACLLLVHVFVLVLALAVCFTYVATV